jgi:group I intron endonuclease
MRISNKSGIYKIQNIINNKVYVGSAINLRKRKNNHLSDLRYNRHSSSHLQNAFNKYGEKTFKFVVLESVKNIIELEEREIFWIKKLKSHINSNGYNARIFVTDNRNLKHSEETKKKISENRKGKGKHKQHITEETKKLKSKLCKSQNLKQYHTPETEKKRLKKLRESIYNKPISSEHKKAISRKNKGSNNGMAKLKESDVLKIKNMLLTKKYTMEIIANKFNVCRRTIGAIKSGEKWSHIGIDTSFLITSKNSGIKNTMSKLSETDILQIKELLKNGNTQRFVAEKFNIHKSVISSIASNKRWRKINGRKEKAVSFRRVHSAAR